MHLHFATVFKSFDNLVQESRAKYLLLLMKADKSTFNPRISCVTTEVESYNPRSEQSCSPLKMVSSPLRHHGPLPTNVSENPLTSQYSVL